MFQRKIAVFTLIMFLLAGNIFWALDFVVVKKELKDFRFQVATHNQHNKSLLFLQSFIEKVVRSNEAVSFETRLKLENDVRELDDAKILEQWQLFVNSPTEAEAQKNVKELLSLLIVKAISGQTIKQ